VSVIFAVLIAVGAASLVIILSSIVTSILARKLKGKPELLLGVLTQVMIIAFTLLITYLLTRDLRVLGSLSIPPIDLGKGVALAALVSLVTYFLGARIKGRCNPPIKLRSVWEFVVLAFVVAPTGEELLFRGMVEGYLLASGAGIVTSVALPATMFSLVHIAPYRGSGRSCLAVVITSALAIGLIAGLFRASTGSITLPIVIHAVGNLAGLKQYLGK